MIDKVEISKMDGKFYDYSIKVMGREVALLTSKELLDLYNQITDIMVDNDELMR